MKAKTGMVMGSGQSVPGIARACTDVKYYIDSRLSKGKYNDGIREKSMI
jgi:hypothetical protein